MSRVWFGVRCVVTLVVGAAALAGSVALLAPAVRSLRSTTTPLGDVGVSIGAPATRSVVYDRFGHVLGAFSVQDRAPVTVRDVPPVLINAVLSIEDRRFYEHHGVDWVGLARALTRNVDAGGITQGGSTITEQLVKNSMPSTGKRDLKAKIREAVRAIRLEHELTKNEILQDYLNLVYFGSGAYGVQAATERYFNEPLKQLTLAQAALLAGLIQAPEGYNPTTHPDRAARRRDQVLDAMVANQKITVAAANAARSVPLPTHVFEPVSHTLDYYLNEVRNQLLNNDRGRVDDPAAAIGPNQQARAAALYRGGLQIFTAYDPTLQFEAQAAINSILPKSPFSASVVVIDNNDGGVHAIANGRPFAQSQFDPATNGPGRQAGSTFKTFTLAAALSHGDGPDDQVLADPLYDPSADPGWNPLQGDCHGGTPTLRTAIAISDNCAFVRLERSLGPGNGGRDGVKQVIDTAHTMGIDSAGTFDPTALSTTLGTQGVHPLEMAQAYSVLPDDGILKRATIVTKILGPTGKVLYQHDDPGHRVLDPNVARTEIDMLKGVLRDGTASESLANFPRPAAGKTGTTDNNIDAWFVGFTPQLTAAVWMGNPDGEQPMIGLPIGPVFGATYPAQIWRQFMLQATANLPPLDFMPPDPTQWPAVGYINEDGRQNHRYFPPTTAAPAPTTTPTTVQPKKARQTPATTPTKRHRRHG